MPKFQGMWDVQYKEAPHEKSTWGTSGLKAHRGAPGKKPEHNCSNCRCVRYSPCKCSKKEA